MADKKISSVLVIGANQGIGLEFVKQFLKLKASLVIATYRCFNSAGELKKLKIEHSNLKLLKLNLLDFDSYEEFGCQVDQLVGDSGIELLVHNAGVYIEDKIGSIAHQNMLNAFTTNSVSPVLLTQQLLPLLKLSASKRETTKGSISQNNGNRYSHRVSKAALNQGMVKTKMANFEGEIDAETSVSGMLKVVFDDEIDKKQMIAWNGQQIAW